MIERTRIAMYVLARENSLTSKIVIRKSRHLDRLHNLYEWIKKQKVDRSNDRL